MTPQIKQRLDQIQRGEVPKGYRRTKAGLMPIEWCEKREYRARDIFRSITNKRHNGEFEVLSATQDKGVVPRSQVDIDIKFDENSVTGYKKVDCGDFVISLRSFQGGIEYSEYEGLVSPAYTVLKPILTICDGYFKAYFKSNDFISRLNKGTYGIRDGKQIGYEDFGDMVVHLPPLPEQQKIAEILSAQDKLIALKEKLIEEKKRQKKYLMQQLLTGKKRLPGFVGRWNCYLFSEIFSFLPTNTLSRENMTYDTCDICNIHYGDILTKYSEVLDCRKVRLPYIKNDAIPRVAEFVQEGDIIIADTAEDNTVGKAIELNNVQGFRILSGLHTMLCRPIKGKFSRGWLGYFINSDAYHKQLIPLICGIKVSSISKKEILKTSIMAPSLEEQTAIVTTLAAMDHEIDLLNYELRYEKQKKKALMQLLLTGIVRV